MAEIGNQKGDLPLIAALAGGATVQDAAKRASVSERTAHRRLEDADFRRRVDETRAEVLNGAVGRLADASTGAADTLRALLSADSETVRLGACRAILELGTKLRESLDLEQRIAVLEEQIAAGEQPRGGNRWRA